MDLIGYLWMSTEKMQKTLSQRPFVMKVHTVIGREAPVLA